MAVAHIQISISYKNINFPMRLIFGGRKFDHVSDLREQLRLMTQAQTLS